MREKKQLCLCVSTQWCDQVEHFACIHLACQAIFSPNKTRNGCSEDSYLTSKKPTSVHLNL